MREAGKVVATAHRLARELTKPGVETIVIDRAIEDHYKSNNALPLFKGVLEPRPEYAAALVAAAAEPTFGVMAVGDDRNVDETWAGGSRVYKKGEATTRS